MLCLLLQSLKNMQTVDLTAMVQHIPADTHIYWYTAENGVRHCTFMPLALKK